MKIKTDSRKVVPGDTFIAIRETNNNGHRYIKEAIDKGATTIVAEDGPYSVNTIVVKDTKDYLVKLLKQEYYHEIEDIKLIGVTGTNGKTTTAYSIYQSLNHCNMKCAYIGTIGFYIDGKIKNLNNTTPNILDLYEMIIESKKNGCKYVAMEVSSHALAKGRVKGLKFEYAIFTNLTQDHLDYHLTMKDYALAKQKLFNNVEKYSFINNDDYYKNYFLTNESITYGLHRADYKVIDYNISINGSTFIVNYNYKFIEYETDLIGIFNIYNLLPIIALLDKMEIPKAMLKEAISSIISPPGRMEKIPYNENMIIVDYAHTPDAIYKVLETVSQIYHNNIYTIIGCGGNRDKTKRKEMAEISSKLSDKVIFTTDNPRYEMPEAILSDMVYTLDKHNYEIEINRENAIKKGIQMLDKNDILLVLGKGHETYQEINGIKYDFNDSEKVLKYIRR